MGKKADGGGEDKKKRKSKDGDSGGEKKRKGEKGSVSSSAGEGSGEKKKGTVVNVRVESEREGTTGAMLACFSDAPPPLDDLQSAGGITLACVTSGRNRVLTGETETLVFEGVSKTGGTAAAFKYMVGLYDPEKGEVVVADPGMLVAGNVVSLKRRVKSVSAGGSLAEMTREQARDQLVDAFGSKRVRSVHRQRKGQELEKEGDEALGKLEKELLVKKEEAAVAKALTPTKGGGDDEGPSDLAPRCDLQASSPAGVYALRDVVGDEEWESLQAGQMLDMAKDMESETAKMLPEWIRAQLPSLLATPDKKDRRRRAKLLMYCAFMILYNSLPSRFNKTAQALRDELGMPFVVAQRMLSTYAEPADRGYTRPQGSRDRLLLALCVLVLMYTDYEVSFGQLAADLKLHPDKLAMYFRELGAAVSKPKGLSQPNYMSKLVVPLTFPKRSRGPMKGR